MVLKKELSLKSPISKRRECLIKFILMRVPIENGLGFISTRVSDSIKLPAAYWNRG
jgi:hypothetical protein